MFDFLNKIYIAGPCAIESEDQICSIALKLQHSGATHLRGGAYKPRTSPESFQGLGKVGLDYLIEAGRYAGLPVVSELVDISHLDYFRDVDIIQVGARNMQNFELLKQLGRTQKTILLKRGFCNTLDELMHSVDYILSGGNSNIILCERGIRTFDNCSRFTLDFAAVIYLKNKTKFPVIVDPSHAAGDYTLVSPLAKAAMAVGADGIMVEVHDNPRDAMCDADQAISSSMFHNLILNIEKHLYYES